MLLTDSPLPSLGSLSPPEMPSFVPDGSSAIDSQSSGVLHLDRATEFGFPQGKVDGQIARRPPHSHTSNDSFDKSSTNSTNSSGTSETSIETEHKVMGDSSRLHPQSMNSSPNGSTVGGINGVGANDLVSRKQPPFGNPATLVDRTVSSGTAKGKGNYLPPRIGGEDPSQRSGVEVHLQPVNRGDVRTVEKGLASPTFPIASAPALAPESSSPTSSQRNQQAPHRYSSPPVYEQSPSSSGLLQSPPAQGIKHRHTLEVPKISSARGSRDGVDAAFASGRFSPAGGRRASLSLARRNTRSLHSDGPRDEVIPDEDAIRWAEAYRQKRATKRRRREIEDDDRVLVGTKVDETHANWVTAYNMLTGIRVAVSRTNAKLDRPLTDADFSVKQKSTFDM